MMTNPLLQRYVTERSETAFAELVRLHIDLVYSAALRQVNGDAAAAQDVTQAVFTDLARKAPRLLRHASLAGWLYTSTRYLCAKARRSEQRRLAREQEAYAMNQLLQSTDSDPAWQELRPVLDEAMHELGAEDREAVLLRYFERRPIAEIGTRLGLKEDAARKRVDRALDKLRAGLARRGITSTVAALGVALAQRAVSAAPSGIAAQISQTAMASVSASGGGIALLLKLLAGAGAAATVAGLIALPRILHRSSQAAFAEPSVAMDQPADVASPPSASESTPTQSADTTNKLVLHIVAADSGQPIPSVTLDYWLWTGTDIKHEMPLTASRLGLCELPVPRATTTELILVSQREGFADTRLQWHVDRGEPIPQEYTLRLPRAVSIGGTVVDADGNPVAGAEVGFNNHVDASEETAVETSHFGWPFWITATTDAHGRWQLNRMSSETIRTIHGSASHPLHVGSGFDDGKPEVQQQLLAGTYEFRLGRAVEVQGSVVDTNGQPVPRAEITVGAPGGSDRRETRSGAQGRFHVAGCAPEKTFLTAEANGFAPITMAVDLSTNTGPFRLTLQGGKLLRLRVVNTAGMPVPKAGVWLNTFANDMRGENSSPPVQVNFSRKTDPDGCLEWSGAPDCKLTFNFSAPGYMHVDGQNLTPDGQEHVIVLPSAVTISGTVRDGATGELIPSFKLIAGWPETNSVTGAVSGHWSGIDRFWMSFSGGKFHHVFEEGVLGGTPNPGYMFKVVADGYAAFVTRVVAANEGDVQLDVTLHAAAASTVTVTLPDGRLAASVNVGIVSPSAGLRLVPGGFLLDSGQETGGSLLLTDSKGRFTLAADDSVTLVIAASPDGYAEATPAALAAEPSMVLQPWGRLEGTFMVQGRAATNGALQFEFATSPHNGVSTDFIAYKVKTDSAGHFAFAQVPPGSHKLVQIIEVPGSPSPTGMVWTSQPLADVDIRPGETTTVIVNGK
jgi:RNA polymerase sigma factor (sigma-70 family)